MCALGPNTAMISLFQVGRTQNTQKKKRGSLSKRPSFVYFTSIGITNQVFMAPQTLITCPLT